MTYTSDVNDDQFTKLFKRMEDGFTDISARLDTMAKKVDLDRLIDTMDELVQCITRSE